MTANTEYKVAIIAGEASGDALGGKLMQALKADYPETHFTFIGVGGERMEAEGIKSIFPMNELSIIGWIEILPHIPHLLKRINQTVESVITAKPNMVITVDAPAFNKRVAKKLKSQAQHIPLVHYVAPTVWAYKPKRAQKFADIFDHLLLLLPFEKQHFDAVDLPSTFVGHPVMEEKITGGDGAVFRAQHNIPDETPLLCVMAGSRNNELTRLLPEFTQAIELMAKKYKNIHVVFVSTNRLLERMKLETAEITVPTVIITSTEDKQNAYAASNICLAKSGTGTFEPAMAKLAMVVAYKLNALSAWLLRRMIKTRFVNLINIIHGKEVIPELLQEECNAEAISKALLLLLDDEDIRNKQITLTQEALTQLTLDQAPSHIAARTIKQLLDKA
jgi:lipid-A-disaccharide synthase